MCGGGGGGGGEGVLWEALVVLVDLGVARIHLHLRWQLNACRTAD